VKDTVTEMAEFSLDASWVAKKQTVFPWLESDCIPKATKLPRGCCWDGCRSLAWPTFYIRACKKDYRR